MTITVYLYSQRLNSTRVSGLNRALSRTRKGPHHDWALTVGLWGLTHGGTMRILNLSLFLSPPVQHIGSQVLINLYLTGYPEFPKIYYFYYKSAPSSIER